MTGSSTVRRRPGHVANWTDNRDWLAEFPAESPPNSRLLAGATTLPVITRTPPRSGATERVRTRARTHRSILLTVSAMVLLAMSAGATTIGLWMQIALAPLMPAEWPVSSPPSSSPRATAPSLALSVPELQPQPTPEPAIEAAPVTPAPSTPATVATVTPAASARVPAAPPAVRTQPPAVAAEQPVSSGGGEVSAILSVLDRYRVAFGSLNPGSVRAVFPAADIRALAGEFADVKRQTLAFDNCSIDVQGVQAEAVCAGRVSVVTKSGQQAPAIQSRRWTFTLVHQADTWKISTVARQ